MKQNFDLSGTRSPEASTSRQPPARGRFQLGRALGQAFSLEGFEGRFGGGGRSGGRAAGARAHAERLREVLDRDRALIAAESAALEGTAGTLPPLPAPEFTGGLERAPDPVPARDLELASPALAVESAPVTEAAPVAEITPAIERAPVVETTPVTETAPVAAAAPIRAAAPVVDTLPVVETDPAVETEPVIETAVVSETESVPETAAALAADRAPAPAAVSSPASTRKRAAAPAQTRAPTAVLPPVPPALTASLANDSRASAFDEPIRTRTMARLLAAQGYRKRALGIYEYLLARSDDPALRAEADALRRPGA